MGFLLSMNGSHRNFNQILTVAVILHHLNLLFRNSLFFN